MKNTHYKTTIMLFTVVLFAASLAACNISGPLVGLTSVPELLDSSQVENPAEGSESTNGTLSSINLPEAATAEVPTTDLENRLIELYQTANPSVVYIITSTGSGSGFVYSQDGSIVTNNHVVVGQQDFEVVFSNGDRLAADLVSRDEDSDLAVLQVAELPEGVTALPLAEPGDLQVGQLVIAIGNPFGEQGSMSLGIVSGLGRSLPSQRDLTTGSTYSLPEVIQTDAPINPGNSGGPLLNLDGEVVGVNAAIASASFGTNSGVGFSIPVSAVRLIVPALIENGGYEYPYLGVLFDGEISLDDAETYGLEDTEGAYILSVNQGSPAEQAGLIAANPEDGSGGDLVVALDGQEVDDFADLNSYLVFQARVGQTIQVTVVRNGEEMTIPLTLGARP